MSDDTTVDLSFAAIDALLDRVLQLDDAARTAFLGRLPQTQRAAVLKLLDNSHSRVLDRVADRVRDTVREVAGAEDDAESRAGDWQLKREIGAGGTGQVFYAERRDRHEVITEDGTDSFVQRAAIKILWSHRVKSQFRDRFLRERRILASIDHPGLARFLDGGLLGDGRPWFAMEYVEGANIIQFARSLPLARRLALFVDVVDTINYAHQRLIVHRDIKPQNILVDPIGRPRVLDFGIARILGEFDEKDLTRAQGTPVTLQYASPEQVTGRAIDVASDVYQLGLLLFELLTDTRPYRIDESSLRSAIDTICRQVPPLPSTRVDSIDADLDAIVAKALRKPPKDRYASAAALAEDVRRFIAGRPVAARAQSKWYVLTRFLQRNALTSAIVAGSFAALTVATVVSVHSAREARAEAERSRATQDILAAVFEQADPFGRGSASISLPDALVQAKPSIDAQVAGDPRLAWEVNKTLAGIFSNLDMLDLEREAFQSAWSAARELGGRNEAERLFAVAGLGNILAREDPGQAIEFFATHLPTVPANRQSAVDWLSAKYSQVSAFIRLRDFERADAGAHAMHKVATRFDIDAPRTLGRIHQLLAGAAQRAGDAPGADAYWASAVAHMRRADNPHGVAVTLSNQALHLGRTGRYPQAEAAFEESVAIFREHAPDDTSHANVQRLYAGLLFRMRRTDEALAALHLAQSILRPDRQSYEYFVAQYDRAHFSFVAGDMGVSVDAIQRGLDVAINAFGRDSDVTRRMIPVTARLLLFADRPADAARLVMGEDAPGNGQLCASLTGDIDSIDQITRLFSDDAGTEAQRQALWGKVTQTSTPTIERRIGAQFFAEAMAAYRADQSVFLDVLDRHRLLSALNEIGQRTGTVLTQELSEELTRLSALKTAARLALGDDGAGPLGTSLEALYAMSEEQFVASCATVAQPAVVSRTISR